MKKVHEKLLNELYSHIWGRILSDFPDGAHSKELGPALKKICREVISEEGSGSYICQTIREIPAVVIGMLDKEDDRKVGQMKLIYKIQREMDRNRRVLLISQTMEGIIDDLIVVYKEVFSDIAASAILGCTEEQFIEAFTVSEGARKGGDEYMKSREHRIRVKMLRNAVFSKKSHDKITMKQEVLMNDPFGEMYVELYNYKWVQKWLLDYANEIHKKLVEYLSKPEKCEEVREIKEVFRILSDSESGLEKVYLVIEEKIKSHKENVTKAMEEYWKN